MTQTLAVVLVLYLALVAVLAVSVSLGAPLTRAVQTGVVVAEVMLVVQAVLDVAQLLGGSQPNEPAVHLGYVVVSVLLLPLLLLPVELHGGGAVRRGGHGVVALACLVTMVVVLRQRSTA